MLFITDNSLLVCFCVDFVFYNFIFYSNLTIKTQKLHIKTK